MTSRIATCLLLCGLFVSLARAETLPFHWPAGYSIEYIKTGMGDPMHVIYTVDGNKARNDLLDSQKGNIADVTIFDLDKKTIISLNPASKIARETPINNVSIRHMFKTDGIWEKLGTESISGVQTDKYKISKGDSFFYVWLSSNNHEPVRMTNNLGDVVTNIKRYIIGAQTDPNFFSIPAGYQ